ncbi:fam-b protein [Plasmodium chabaudi chabaudi]|uniref:Fam-b protein n=1 Tax=Plasmodium chabaudi chabaudi TaxID=31271 RepID=A0A1C6YEU5_PLACU|nr:fam-b protein [Plasmodium chabaudi chabaudi]
MKQFSILKKFVYFSMFIWSLEHTTNVLCDLSADRNIPTLLAPLDLKINMSPRNIEYVLDLMHSYDSIIDAVAEQLKKDAECGETKGVDDDTESEEKPSEDSKFGVLGGIVNESECSKSYIMKRSMRANKKSDNIYQDKKPSQPSDNTPKKKKGLFATILSKIFGKRS